MASNLKAERGNNEHIPRSPFPEEVIETSLVEFIGAGGDLQCFGQGCKAWKNTALPFAAGG